MINSKNLFITGKPACGKTSLVKEVCFKNLDKAGGFYTEEITEENERRGFLLKTLDGKEGVLAKKGMKSGHKLNKYGIDLNVLEGFGIEAIKGALKENKAIVIDEIGTMEVISQKFRQALLESLNSNAKVLATIRYNSQPFTDEIKKMTNTQILYLTRENYHEVKEQVLEWLQ